MPKVKGLAHPMVPSIVANSSSTDPHEEFAAGDRLPLDPWCKAEFGMDRRGSAVSTTCSMSDFPAADRPDGMESGGLFDFDALDEKEEDGDVSSVAAASSPGCVEHMDENLVPPTVQAALGARSGELCRKIALVVNGTLGDVDPVIALAAEMQQRHYDVLMLVNHGFVEHCMAAGVRAIAIFVDHKSLFASTGGVVTPSNDSIKTITKEEIWQSMLATSGDLKTHYAVRSWEQAHAHLLGDPFEELARFGPSLILSTALGMRAAMSYEFSHNVPVVPVNFTPLCPPLELQPQRPSLFAISSFIDNSEFSEQFGRVTGAWVRKRPSGVSLLSCGITEELQDFVEAGEKPVAVGWGCMLARGFSPEKMLELALRALMLMGKRAVVLGGWAELHSLGQELIAGGLENFCDDHETLRRFAQSHVFFTPYAPHWWLFPRSCCAVHHGGSGTTLAAISAGCPSVVTPFFGDQFEYSRRIGELKAGVGFRKALPLIGAEELAQAMRTAASTTAPQDLVRSVLAETRGVQVAANVIGTFYEVWIESSRFSRMRGQMPPALESASRALARRHSV